jgi:hypothetical protein
VNREVRVCNTTLYLKHNFNHVLPQYFLFVDVIGPVFNLEPKYRVTVLTREIDQRTWVSYLS